MFRRPSSTSFLSPLVAQASSGPKTILATSYSTGAAGRIIPLERTDYGKVAFTVACSTSVALSLRSGSRARSSPVRIIEQGPSGIAFHGRHGPLWEAGTSWTRVRLDHLGLGSAPGARRLPWRRTRATSENG